MLLKADTLYSNVQDLLSTLCPADLYLSVSAGSTAQTTQGRGNGCSMFSNQGRSWDHFAVILKEQVNNLKGVGGQVIAQPLDRLDSGPFS